MTNIRGLRQIGEGYDESVRVVTNLSAPGCDESLRVVTDL